MYSFLLFWRVLLIFLVYIIRRHNLNYYDEIKENLLKSEIYDKAKDYAKDINKVKVYYETG